MTKKIYKKVMFVGRATTFVVGLTVMLALTVGLASTALAGTGVGARFDLGKTNTVNALSTLAGSVAGPSLQIDNNSTNAAATALDLQVEPGKAPMKVNSATQVANLNSDKLDNLDSRAFVRSTYTKILSTTGDLTTGNQHFDVLLCEGDDFALGGGYNGTDLGTEVLASAPRSTDGWQARWKNDATIDTINLLVLCADVGTPRQ
jgi:hypothetical protein